MQSLRRYKFSALGVFALSSLHPILIETNNAFRRSEPQFLQGSADDLVLNNLKTGDLVLFSRRPYLYHLPVALMIAAYKRYTGCDYDHAGVVVEDEYGVPHVVEVTPFRRGLQCRPFEARVRWSESDHILVIPLALDQQWSKEERKRVWQAVSSRTNSTTAGKSDTLSSEETSLILFGELRGQIGVAVSYLASFLLRQFPKGTSDELTTASGGRVKESAPFAGLMCYNTAIVLYIMHIIGLSTHICTFDTFSQRRLLSLEVFTTRSLEFRSTKSGETIVLTPADVSIRSR